MDALKVPENRSNREKLVNNRFLLLWMVQSVIVIAIGLTLQITFPSGPM